MNLEIKKRELENKCGYYPNAVILPQKIDGDYPMWGLGGVGDSNGDYVESSFYDGGWATHGGKYEWNKDEEIYIDADVIYFGMFFNHWGHFLVDLIGRMWFPACSEKYSSSMKVAYLGEELPNVNNLEFFRLLGVDKKQLLHVTKPIRCRNVIVPELAARSCDWYSNTYKLMFDSIVSKAEREGNIEDKYAHIKKLYFTRRCFGKAMETELGEEIIEKIFAENGYTILAPETLSLSEQIYLWNHAETIACINGTIPLNAAFCMNNHLNVIILNKTSIFHGNPYLYLNMRNLKADFVDIYKEPFKKYPKSLGEGPFLMEVTHSFCDWLNDNDMMIPFTKHQLFTKNVLNRIKYLWCILGIRRKARILLYKLVPQSIKDSIRSILGKGQ